MGGADLAWRSSFPYLYSSFTLISLIIVYINEGGWHFLTHPQAPPSPGPSSLIPSLFPRLCGLSPTVRCVSMLSLTHRDLPFTGCLQFAPCGWGPSWRDWRRSLRSPDLQTLASPPAASSVACQSATLRSSRVARPHARTCKSTASRS